MVMESKVQAREGEMREQHGASVVDAFLGHGGALRRTQQQQLCRGGSGFLVMHEREWGVSERQEGGVVSGGTSARVVLLSASSGSSWIGCSEGRGSGRARKWWRCRVVTSLGSSVRA